MTILRFVHAADLHLDSPFRGIRNEAPSHVEGALSSATFDAYRNIIDLCLREQVAALLVAGDIYDGADRSLRAQLHFADGLAQSGKGRHPVLHLPRQPRPSGRLGGPPGPAGGMRPVRAGGRWLPGVPGRAGTGDGPRGELPDAGGAGEPDAPLCRSGLRTGFQHRAPARQRWREP